MTRKQKVFLFLISIPLAIIYGFVLMLCWNWTLVPYLKVPVLTMHPAIAINLIAAYLTHQNTTSNNDFDGAIESVFHNIGLSIFVFVGCLIIHLNM